MARTRSIRSRASSLRRTGAPDRATLQMSAMVSDAPSRVMGECIAGSSTAPAPISRALAANTGIAPRIVAAVVVELQVGLGLERDEEVEREIAVGRFGEGED